MSGPINVGNAEKQTEKQRQQIKKAQAVLRLGVSIIVIIGLAVAIYFIFLRDSGTISKVSTKDWLSYDNEFFGYRFKYPANMYFDHDEPEQYIDLKGPDLASGNEWPRFLVANYSGAAYEVAEGTDVSAWVGEKFEYTEFGESKKIAGLTATHVTGIRNSHDDLIDRYYLARSGQLFHIDILHTDGTQDWDLYNAFLASFEFYGPGTGRYAPPSDGIVQCENIHDQATCDSRPDCMSFDACSCTTEYKRKTLCGEEDAMPCLCITGGFESCGNLLCGGIRQARLADGVVSVECVQTSDCAIVDSEQTYRSEADCCPEEVCADYSEDKYAAVNKADHAEFVSGLKTAAGCDTVFCEQVLPPECPTYDYTFSAVCQNGVCLKY